jgi:hypothetical protein
MAGGASVTTYFAFTDLRAGEDLNDPVESFTCVFAQRPPNKFLPSSPLTFRRFLPAFRQPDFS